MYKDGKEVGSAKDPSWGKIHVDHHKSDSDRWRENREAQGDSGK